MLNVLRQEFVVPHYPLRLQLRLVAPGQPEFEILGIFVAVVVFAVGVEAQLVGLARLHVERHREYPFVGCGVVVVVFVEYVLLDGVVLPGVCAVHVDHAPVAEIFPGVEALDEGNVVARAVVIFVGDGTFALPFLV